MVKVGQREREREKEKNSDLSCITRLTNMTEQEEKKLFERLPQTIVPVHYNLTIQPFLETFKFNGTVIIDIQV